MSPAGYAYGWQAYGTTGHSSIPAVSALRLGDWICGSYTSLVDVVRHEFGHAFAHTHRGVFRSRRFRDAFDAPHDCEDQFVYDPELHPSEDFAETFALYLKCSGRLPRRLGTAEIAGKWGFVREVGRAIGSTSAR